MATTSRRHAYANELTHAEHLIAVSAGANRSNGGKDPASWLPENAAYRCGYVRAWVLVKLHWGLRADDAELTAIDRLLRVRYERRADIHEAFLILGGALICWKALQSGY